ncbi:MAG TPA: glycosyltransferase family 39 protein [Candidatus Krumholzibacteria bacterium]|nr:glycosyltransferase family 39 protein [Candidatus Krumholzibacteria bacterium]
MHFSLQRDRGMVACVAAAAALRAFCIVATRNDPVFRVPYLDSAFYHTWARSLAEGRGDFQGPYFLGPLYPHVLSWLYRAFGADPLVARLFQSALGVVDVALVYALARHLGGRTAAVAAAALFALHGCFIFYENLLVLEPLLTTLLLVALVSTVLPRGRVVRVILAGLCLGLAALTRSTALLAAPVVVWALARGTRPWRSLAWCAIACLVVLVPVLLRNVNLGAGFVLTTNGGVNFYAGNFPGAKGRFRQPEGVQFFTSPDVLPESAALPTAVAARPLTLEAVAGTREAGESAVWLARSWNWIHTQPGAFVATLLRRVGLTLQGRDIAQIESFAFHRSRLPALRLFLVDLTWILPLAALGFWHLRRGDVRFVLGFAIAALLPCVLFFVTSRHRLPALPALAVLAGSGASVLAAHVSSRRWSRLAITMLVLVVAGALTRVGAQPPRTATGWESAQMAERVYALDDLAGAIRWQEAAFAWLPQRPEIGRNLALYLSERARPEDLVRAESLLLQQLQRAPSDLPLLDAFGTVLAQRGRVHEARTVWQRVLQLDPGYAPARDHLRALGDAPPGSP